MKKQVNYFLSFIFLFVLFLSCQKELNFENSQVSGGSLKSDISGDCLPKTVGGTFIAGKDLGDTNYIEVAVNVTGAGPYSIATNTVNGYSFKGAGDFSATGSNTIRLTGTGKPLVTGIDDFTVTYDTSHCTIRVNVSAPGGGSGNVPAGFTLQGAPAACTPATISGAYVKSRALGSGDSVNIALNVTTPGTYSISTNTVNGYSFSGSGVLAASGIQSISLTGSGTPLDVGTNTFIVTAGASSCTFSVTVTAAVTVAGEDYFPLTKNSYWTYDNLFSNAGDTIKRIVTDTVRTNGLRYQLMKQYGMYNDTIQHFFRRGGNAYFEYGSVDDYTESLSYEPPVLGEIPFLKENLATGDSWTSEKFTGYLSSGQPVITRYDFFCLDANAAVTLNGKTFINVYKIRLMPKVTSTIVYDFNTTGEVIDLYYAKGIGLIYIKGTNNGYNKIEYQIRYWMVY